MGAADPSTRVGNHAVCCELARDDVTPAFAQAGKFSGLRLRDRLGALSSYRACQSISANDRLVFSRRALSPPRSATSLDLVGSGLGRPLVGKVHV